MKTDKEISENYIQSAERSLKESKISSIEWAVVHYKRAVLFDPTNVRLQTKSVHFLLTIYNLHRWV